MKLPRLKLLAALAGCAALALAAACASKDADTRKVPLESMETTITEESRESGFAKQTSGMGSNPGSELTSAPEQEASSVPDTAPESESVPSQEMISSPAATDSAQPPETTPAPTSASAIQTAPETAAAPQETSAAHALVSSLQASEDTDSLITVVGTGGYQAVTTYYRKNSDGIWEEIFSSSGVYGKNGASSDKKEGDGKTPSGVYRFTMAFGIKPDPGSGSLPYHQVASGDFWVDDSDSAHYNQLVTSQTKKDWTSAEDLSKGAPYYNYALVLDYNTAQTPGKGSAIFLHCTKSSSDTGSAGCIRIPESKVIELIENVDEDTKIVIAPDAKSLLGY